MKGENEQKVTFKYHPNLWQLAILEKHKDGSLAVCECCEKETLYYYQGIYAIEEVESLCLECIKNGKAAKNTMVNLFKMQRLLRFQIM